MRALALVCFVAFAARAELPEKSKWSWSVVSGGGMSSRFMLVFESPAPARKAREWWTVETGARDVNGRMPVTLTTRNATEVRKVQFNAWNENGVTLYADASAKGPGGAPVVKRSSPPRVLSMERVPCEATLLGYSSATCSGLAGGPLSQPELPLVVVVSFDKDHTGETLASLAMGLITAGIIIPGSTNSSVVARMDAPPVPKLEKTLETWRKGAHTTAALEKLNLARDVDAETLGALLVLSKTPSLEVVTSLTARAPELDRWPLLRLTRQTVDDDVLLTRAVARLVVTDSLRQESEQLELQKSALVGVDAALVRGIEGLLTKSMPGLQAVAAGNAPIDAASLQLLQTSTLTPGEGAALAMLMSPGARKKSFPSFLDRLPDDEGLAVFLALSETDTAGGKLTLLEKVPAWVDRLMRNGRGKDVLEILSFDAERVKLLDGVRARAKPEELPTLLFTGMRAMTFDGGRLSLLRKWKATPLTLAQRLEVIEIIRLDPELSSAAKELLVGLEESERRTLVFAWLKRCTNDEQRIQGIEQQLPTLRAAEAKVLISSFTFDDAKKRAAPVLLSRVSEAERAELFVDFVVAMSFDSGRLGLLELADAPKLNAAQRERALRSFSFEREKGEALLRRSP